MAVGTGGATAGAPARPGARRPIPTWVWIAGAGGVFILYYLYRQNQANAAAAATTAAAATAPPVAAAGSYGNAGDISSLLPYLQAAGNSGTGQGSGATFTPPPGEVQQGSGFWVPKSGTPISDAQGNQFVWIPTGAALKPFLQGGGTAYYQPTPGIFVPASAGGNLLSSIAPGTPIYQQVS